MWGWKTVERIIESNLTLAQAKERLEKEGFVLHSEQPEHVILKRKGTSLTIHADDLSLEVALVKTETGLFLQVRYDSFVLFDTGDLTRWTDQLVASLTA